MKATLSTYSSFSPGSLGRPGGSKRGAAQEGGRVLYWHFVEQSLGRGSWEHLAGSAAREQGNWI